MYVGKLAFASVSMDKAGDNFYFPFQKYAFRCLPRIWRISHKHTEKEKHLDN